MSYIFHVILYQPIYNLFVGLYNVLPGHDVGIVILAITVIIRIIIYPLTTSSIRAQKSMQELQPKMDEIKKQYANDQQKQAQALMELYRNNKVNPFASCLPLLIQLPILIALYTVMRDALASKGLADVLYAFVTNPGTINPLSLGFFHMDKANIYLAVLAGGAQYIQAKMSLAKQPPKEAGTGAKDENIAAMMSKQMLYMMPIMTVLIGASLQSGLTLYWLLSTLLMIAQQWWMFRKKDTGSNSSGTPRISGNNIIDGQIVK